MEQVKTEIDPASFRDPSGFVFRGSDGLVYRQVNQVYEPHYRRLMDSGLYEDLAEAGLMVPHEEVDSSANGSCRILRPYQIDFVSYPYEWSFSQFKDAALLTLEVQRRALKNGMILKDASAYNVQFNHGKPIFIDTLSFETRVAGAPWVGYGQFCSHFLAPLALMAYTDIRLQRLMETFIDGIPLDLASKLLPRRTRLKPGLAVHLFLHAWMQKRYSDTSSNASSPSKTSRVNEAGIQGMTDGLSRLITKLSWKPAGSEWADYYTSSSYSDGAIDEKRHIVDDYLGQVSPGSVWDLGANTGLFSRIAAQNGSRTIAFDIDPACVEVCYSEIKKSEEQNLLPLRLDLTNPSPSLGWANKERRSLADRGPADLVMMLALIHHLAIANNVPFASIAEFARSLSRWLIIEFVPKNDPQTQRLLRSRVDIFDSYNQKSFESVFAREFTIVESRPVGSDGRVIYLMKANR